LKFYECALEVLNDKEGVDSEDSLDTICGIATVNVVEKRDIEAISIYKRALELCKKESRKLSMAFDLAFIYWL